MRMGYTKNLCQTYAFIPSKFACTNFTVFGILPIFIPVYLVCLSFCVLKAHFLSGSCRKWKHFDFHIWSSLRKHLKRQEMSSAGTGRGGLPKPSPVSAALKPSSTMSLRYAHCPLGQKVTRNCQKVLTAIGQHCSSLTLSMDPACGHTWN